MMKNLLLIFALTVLSYTVQGQSHEHKVLTSSIRFEISNAGITVDGTLNELDAMIIFNGKNPDKGEIKATLDPATIKTGITIRDNHLKRSDYFHVEKYPEIHIVSKAIQQESTNSYIGTFDLTIKNITNQILIPIEVVRNKDSYKFNGILELNRLDYTLGEESMILSNDVKIFIKITSETRNK